MTFDDPVVIARLMPTNDRRWRSLADEYMAVPSMRTLMLIDWESERLFLAQRTGDTGWQVERDWTRDVEVPSLGLTISHAEIFARD